jgi:hypothetical protein
MSSVSIFRRRFAVVCAGIAIAAAPAIAVLMSVDDVAPRLTAECQDIQQEGSFSMDCAPAVEPNNSDQLTEQEVAEPGFNASPGGHTGSGGSSGHH